MNTAYGPDDQAFDLLGWKDGKRCVVQRGGLPGALRVHHTTAIGM